MSIVVDVLLRFLFPFLWCYLVTVSYSLVFKKQFMKSMAPAFFLQSILVTFLTMIIGSISVAIAVSIVANLIALLYGIITNRKDGHPISKLFSYEIVIFFFFYAIIWISNYGKHFGKWDEFSHWGRFIKETIRLDNLYCNSPKYISHKTYVPGITVFEVIWSKLSRRYSEADAYRAIQILESSMLLSIVFHNVDNIKEFGKRLITIACRFVVLFGIGFLFPIGFYHSIYLDTILGIIIAYCMWIIITESETIYKEYILALALSFLILGKVSAIVFLPMITIFYLVYSLLYRPDESRTGYLKHIIVNFAVVSFIPIVIWRIVNAYISSHVDVVETQGYSSMGLKSILGVITHTVNDYQYEVDPQYLWTMFFYKTVGKLSYVGIIILVIAALLVLAKFNEDKITRSKLKLIALWCFLSGITYAISIYFAYNITFIREEALLLNSLARYLCTQSIAIIYLLLGIVFSFELKHKTLIQTMIAIVAVQNLLFYVDINQALPGIITGESIQFENQAQHIIDNVAEDETVYVVTTLAHTNVYDSVGVRLGYYCMPVTIVHSQIDTSNLVDPSFTKENLFYYVRNSDYLYLMDIDDAFIDYYGELFADSSDELQYGRMYEVTIVDNLIVAKLVN